MQHKAVITSSESPIFTAHQSLAPLNSGVAAEIIDYIEVLHRCLLTVGIPTRPYTLKAAETLLTLDHDKKTQILESLKTWVNIVATSELAPDLGFKQEATFVEKALKQFSFNLKNHKWDNTEEEQILEVYNLNGVQLYRSLGFFRTCGYSLLDLCVNEWFILWERPQKVLQEMNMIVAGVISGSKKDTTVGIAPHLVLETYDDGCTQPFTPRAMLVTFKNIYPLYTSDDHICGFVVSSTAKLISEGEDIRKLNFI